MSARHTLAACACFGAAAAAQAADPGGRPLPGEYRVDSDTTSTTRNAAGAMVERLQQVDGATGRIRVTLRDSFSSSAPPAQTYPGDGPNRWCVSSAGTLPPLPSAAQAGLTSGASIGAASASLQAVCQALSFDEKWRRIDARTWMRELRAVPASAGAGGVSPPLAGMPPAGATAAAMAPVIAALEEQARTGSPGEAAQARQRLAALRDGAGSGITAGGVSVTVRERWTRVAESCQVAR